MSFYLQRKSSGPVNGDWKLDQNANAGGTSFHNHIVPGNKKTFEELFGYGGEGDGYKVTYDYTFTNKDGEVGTLYDYKGDNGHVGACCPEVSESLYNWLMKQIND